MLVQTDGAVRGERTARLELFRGVLRGPGEFQSEGYCLKRGLYSGAEMTM